MKYFWWIAAVAALSFGCDDGGAGTPVSDDVGPDTPERELADIGVDAATCVPSEELCNGVDDNCDGNIDEGYDGLGGVCSRPDDVCPSSGTWVCDEAGTGTLCDAPVIEVMLEICDGTDNDCDGRVDEGIDFAVDPNNCGGCERVCEFENANAGCFEGTCEMVSCAPGFGDPNQIPVDGCECVIAEAGESCNGADDDCDSEIDEGLGLGEACTTGVGACGVVGTKVCGADGDVVCDAVAGMPGEESCNGLDDNCDGTIDEGFDGDGDGAAFCPGVDCDACAAGAPCEVICPRQDCADDDPTRFPGARDICDDDIDQDCSGADAACDGPTGRVNTIQIADGPGCRDLNGDGLPDNSLSGAALFANDQIQASLDSDQLNLFAVALGLSGERFDLGIVIANPVGGRYVLDPTGLDAQGLPSMLFPGAELDENGDFTAGPGQFFLDVPFNGVVLQFVVESTQVTGNVQIPEPTSLAIDNGWITGFVAGDQVETLLLLIPDIADIIRLFLVADVDTDGDGEPDAYSACLTYTATPAVLDGFPVEDAEP